MLEKLSRTPGRNNSASDLYDWDELVQEDRVHRLIYTDPAIFEAEMTHVFGAVWVYLGHESQIAKPNDYITTRLGLRPIILLRDSNGKIRALFNRCTHRGTTLCRLDKGSAFMFVCPYHGWSFLNTGKLRAVPWPDGYACDFKDEKFNVAQVPRVDSYRGFIFGTLNLDAPPLLDYLGAITKPIDEWLDRQPKGKVAVCEANRLKYKGNWKLAYDNSGDGYHVVFSHRSLLEMENRLADEANKGMSYYKGSPDSKAMYMAYMGHGHHFKDKRPNIEKRAGGLWAVEGPAPGTEHYQEDLRRRYGAKAEDILDLASSEPVNINVFPNFSLLGNHIQVFEPVSVDETNVTWYGTAVVDEDGELGGAVDEINSLRMRTQEQFPNFGEVDDLANFEEIQRGLGVPGGRVDLHAPRARHSRPRDDRRARHRQGAGDRRGLHARIHQGLEAADEDDAQPRGAARAVSEYSPLMPAKARHPECTSLGPRFRGDERREVRQQCKPSTTRRSPRTTSPRRSTSELVDDFTDWQRDDLAIADLAERDRFRMLVEREARLLDQLDFDAWLAHVCARMHLLGAGHAQRRRPAPRDRDLVRRPPPHGRPHLPPAHRLCLVAGAEVAHGADDLERRSVCRRSRAPPAWCARIS